MASITDFLNQNSRTVNRISDESYFRLTEDNDGIAGVIPSVNYDDRDLLLLKMQTTPPTIANIYAEEQELLNSRVQMQLTTEALSNCKIGKQYTWKARDFEQMDKLERLMRSYNGATNGVAEAIEDYFFGRAEQLVPAIDQRATLIAITTMTTGSATFTDPLTNARYSLSYTITAALNPPALTGGARWTVPATANALGDLQAHAELFFDRFGYYPRTVVMRSQMIRDIAAQVSTRLALAQKAGNLVLEGQAPPIASFIEDAAIIELIKERTRCNDVVLFDGIYAEEDAQGNITLRYYLPSNTYFFSEPDLVEKAYVPTVEKDFAPGVFTLAEVVSRLPRVERVAAVVNVIPAVFDARKLAARRVSDVSDNAVVVPV